MKQTLLILNAIILFSFNVHAGGNENDKNIKNAITKESKVEMNKKEGFDHSYKAWTALLKDHVTMSSDNKSSRVDYKNFNKSGLNDYLKNMSSLKKSEFNKWTKDQQLAFYINIYNAYTVKLILDNYPIKSIKKIGSFFSNPWKKEFFKLFNQDFYLDKIEHKMVRESGKYKDARIHFAFNCASVGCPALLNEAWQASKLDMQLDQAAKSFLSDESRNKVLTAKKSVEVSNIFKWYGDDFNDNKMGYSSLKSFFSKYATSIGKTKEAIKLIKSEKYEINFSGYDWNLNK